MKRREVVYSPDARQDLRALFDWIAEVASPDTALGYIERIKAHTDTLEYASERGTLHNDIQPGLRTIGFERRLTIAFTVSANRVTILRLFYAGRNWTEEMRS